MTTYLDNEIAAEWRASGWRVITDGYPDLLVERDGEVLAIEIKRPGDRLRANQSRAAEFFQGCRIPYFVLRQSPSEPHLLHPINEMAKRRDGAIDGLEVATDKWWTRARTQCVEIIDRAMFGDRSAA